MWGPPNEELQIRASRPHLARAASLSCAEPIRSTPIWALTQAIDTKVLRRTVRRQVCLAYGSSTPNDRSFTSDYSTQCGSAVGHATLRPPFECRHDSATAVKATSSANARSLSINSLRAASVIEAVVARTQSDAGIERPRRLMLGCAMSREVPEVSIRRAAAESMMMLPWNSGRRGNRYLELTDRAAAGWCSRASRHPCRVTTTYTPSKR